MRPHSEEERALRRALELSPNLALAHAYLCWPLAIQGAHDEALKSAKRALRLSPNDPLVGAQACYAIAITHFAAARHDNSMASASETVDRYPEYHPGHYLFIAAAGMKRDMDAAARTLAALLRLQPDFSIAWMIEIMPWFGDFWASGFFKVGARPR